MTVVGRSSHGAVAGTLLGRNTSRGDRCRLGELLAHAVFEPPFTERALVEVKPMLLRPDDHTRAHESHEGNDFVCTKPIPVDQIGADQASRATQSSLAVDSDTLLPDSDHLVCHLDKAPHQLKRRASSILKDHVNVLDAHGLEVRRIVKLRVQSDNKSHVASSKMDEHVLEGQGQLGGADFGDCRRQSIELGCVCRGRCDGLMLRRSEGKEMLGDPVEVAHVHSLEFLIPRSQVSSNPTADSEWCFILFKIEFAQSTQTLLLSPPDTIDDILDVQDKIRLAVSRITEGHVRGVGLGDRR